MGAIFGWIGAKLVSIVLPTLTSVIAGMVIGILKKQLTKRGIEITDAQEQQLEKIVVDAIQATEEAARRDHLSSEQKAAMTLAKIQDARPDLTAGSIMQKVDAKLPEVRAKLTPSTPATLGRRH